MKLLAHMAFRMGPSLVFASACAASSPNRALIVNDARVLRRHSMAMSTAIFAMCNAARGIAAHAVLGARDQLKVCRVHACTVPAQVVNDQTIRDCTNARFICNTVGEQENAADSDSTITVASSGAHPHPATNRNFNFLHEARSQWGTLVGHRNLQFRCRAGGVSRTARLSVAPNYTRNGWCQ